MRRPRCRPRRVTATRMAEARPAPRQGTARPGLFSGLLTTLGQGLQWLLLSLLFSVIIEWAGMVLWWPEEGLDHSRGMLARELEYLDRDFRRSVVSSDPARFARKLADRSYHLLFEATRLVDVVRWLSPALADGEQGLRASLNEIYQPAAPFLLAGVQITQVFSVRLAVLVLAMPVFLLYSVSARLARFLALWLVTGILSRLVATRLGKRQQIGLLTVIWVVFYALYWVSTPG